MYQNLFKSIEPVEERRRATLVSLVKTREYSSLFPLNPLYRTMPEDNALLKQCTFLMDWKWRLEQCKGVQTGFSSR